MIFRVVVEGAHFHAGKYSLTEREREIAVCIVTSHWRAAYPTAAHERIAKAAGLPAEKVEAILAEYGLDAKAGGLARNAIACVALLFAEDGKPTEAIDEDEFEQGVTLRVQTFVLGVLHVCLGYGPGGPVKIQRTRATCSMVVSPCAAAVSPCCQSVAVPSRSRTAARSPTWIGRPLRDATTTREISSISR